MSARYGIGTRSAKAFLSIDETAIVLGESRATLYRSIKRGDFPLRVVRINGRLRVPRRAVERLLEGRVDDGPPTAGGEDQEPGPALAACPSCGALVSSPVSSRPMCSAARRSSSSMPSV